MSPKAFDLPTHYVDSSLTLEMALPVWADAHLLAVDIECSLTGMHHCILALLQVSDGEQAWLVDPLKLGDEGTRRALEGLGHAPWIVHDYSGDGIVLKRLYDFMPGSVFDTMLLARALGYARPGLKAMAKELLGIELPKEEQDSNWMLRPLRPTQVSYASRDAALLLPLLRRLAAIAETMPEHGPLKKLPRELAGLMERVRHYRQPTMDPLVEKARKMGYKGEAQERLQKLIEFRCQWGNEGDIAAVMELGNRWILARLAHPPTSIEALAKTMPNPRFRSKRLEALWAVLGVPNSTVMEEDP